MASIIRGTTPTIIYTFKTVDVSDITEAYLTIKQNGSLVLQKGISDADVIENGLSWELTQAETLSINNRSSNAVTIMLNWLTDGGIRGASAETKVAIKGNHIEEVI